MLCLVFALGTDTSVGAGGTLSLGWVSFFTPTDSSASILLMIYRFLV